MFDVLSILYFICKIYYNSPLNKTDCSKNVEFLPWKNDVKQILKGTSFQVLFMKKKKKDIKLTLLRTEPWYFPEIDFQQADVVLSKFSLVRPNRNKWKVDRYIKQANL